METKDALDNLIVDDNKAADINLLASLISRYLKFTKEGEIIFEKEFYKLKDYQKILTFLLGRKVISIKKLKSDFREKIAPKEMGEILGIPSKSITKYFSVELKSIVKNDKREYGVPNYALHKCEEILKKK